MPAKLRPVSWLLVAVVVVLSGCDSGSKKPVAPKAAAKEIETTFKVAPPEVKQEVQSAATSLQSSNFAEALAAMNRAVWAQQQQQLQAGKPAALSQQQKKAVESVIGQTRRAVAQDQKLNTLQLNKAMNELILRTYGEN